MAGDRELGREVLIWRRTKGVKFSIVGNGTRYDSNSEGHPKVNTDRLSEWQWSGLSKRDWLVGKGYSLNE